MKILMLTWHIQPKKKDVIQRVEIITMKEVEDPERLSEKSEEIL